MKLLSFLRQRCWRAISRTLLRRRAMRGRQITLRAPFVNNRANPALFSKPALLFSSKLPKTADPCGKVIYGSPVKTDDHIAVGKVDYQKSAEHSLFVRYLLESKVTPASFDINHNPLSIGTADDALAQALAIGSTYLFSPNVVNSLRLTANRIAAGKFEPKSMKEANIGPLGLGVKAFTYSPYTANQTVSGGFSFSSHGGATRSAIFGVNDDLSIVRGNHQMAVGGQWAAWWANSYSGQYHLPFNFDGSKTGLGLADYLMGYVATLTNGPVSAKNKVAKRIGLYAADTWKLNSKLTLNYGLRWEPYFPIFDRKGGPIHFDYDSFLKGVKSTRFDTTPAGVSFPGDPGFHGREGQDSIWTNFSPRVGFAWDVNGDGRTSVRASAGTFYDFPFTQYQNLATAPPYFPAVRHHGRRFRKSVGELSWRRSIPASVRQRRGPQRSMADLLARERRRLSHSEHAGVLLESQPAAAGRLGLARIGQLPWQPQHPPLVDAAIQSRRLPRTWCLHDQWGQLQHLLHHGQSGTATAAVLAESGGRPVLRLHAARSIRAARQL